MLIQNNPLYDKEFLLELDKAHTKNTYARITALNWNEEPLDRIEGRITAGTINIDGNSAVRRTCSLTMITSNVNINDYLWGLQSKFKLEVGLENYINSNYPEIIWFPQGIYVLNTFNTSLTVNNCTINLSGKDKMCLLNGDISGGLHSQVDFGIEEYYDTNENGEEVVYYNPIPIKTIIKNAVNVYGGEPLHNIIINDLDMCGLELLEYRGDENTPLFLLREENSTIYVNMTMRGSQPCYVEENGKWEPTTIGELAEYDQGIDQIVNGGTVIRLNLEEKSLRYQVRKIVYGDEVGYRPTDLTYAGELIANVGESLTSVLDKIKNMLGDFEYFYDLEGRFIFQQKKTYLNTPWNSLTKTNNDIYADAAAYTSSSVYSFNNSNFFTALTHNPAFNNLKNDFSVWGNKKGITGVDIPIHMRYSLNRKPEYYKNYLEEVYVSESYPYEIESGYHLVDWRELIYQMAQDYYEHHDEDDFLDKVRNNNITNYENYYYSGYTGYETYYIDMEGFWRTLYNPVIYQTNSETKPEWGTQYYQLEGDKYVPVAFESIVGLITPDEGKKYYVVENGKYIEIGDDRTNFFEYGKEYAIKTSENEYKLINIYYFKEQKNYFYQDSEDFNINTHWHKDVVDNPAALLFWFDFIGEGSQLDKYMVCNIGTRTKAINDQDVMGIYFPQVPNVLFITNEEYQGMMTRPPQTGYTYIRIDESLINYFTISSQGKSAYDVVEQLLTENTYCVENLTITSIPIYYLQPNNRIEIYDSETGIEGEFLISKITLPLTYNGTMSITATKAIDTIY